MDYTRYTKTISNLSTTSLNLPRIDLKYIYKYLFKLILKRLLGILKYVISVYDFYIIIL